MGIILARLVLPWWDCLTFLLCLCVCARVFVASDVVFKLFLIWYKTLVVDLTTLLFCPVHIYNWSFCLDSHFISLLFSLSRWNQHSCMVYNLFTLQTKPHTVTEKPNNSSVANEWPYHLLAAASTLSSFPAQRWLLIITLSYRYYFVCTQVHLISFIK